MLVLQPAPVATCAKLPTRGRLEVWEDAMTSRIRLLRESAMNRFPAPSTATPVRPFSGAEVAGPPSPRKPKLPFPATLVIVPAGVTFQIRNESATKRFTAPSTATPTTVPRRPRGEAALASAPTRAP